MVRKDDVVVELINGLKKAQILNKDCQYILLDLEGFLCKENKFMRFSIDDEYLECLKKVFDDILKCDKDAKIVVCAYKDELVDNQQNKFIYADSIWISTNTSEEYLIDIFNEETAEISPSDISNYTETSEMIECEILFLDNSGNIKKVIEVFNETEIKNIKIIYWD